MLCYQSMTLGAMPAPATDAGGNQSGLTLACALAVFCRHAYRVTAAHDNGRKETRHLLVGLKECAILYVADNLLCNSRQLGASALI